MVFHSIFYILASKANVYEKFSEKKLTRRNPIIQIVMCSALYWGSSELISRGPMRRNSFNLNFSVKRWASNLVDFKRFLGSKYAKMIIFLSYLMKNVSYHIPLEREFSKDFNHALIAILLQIQTKI